MGRPPPTPPLAGSPSSGTPKKIPKKKKKNVDHDPDEMDIASVYESQIASLDDTASLQASIVPPTVEDEEDLIDNAEKERRLNKQRMREKKMRESEYKSP